MWLDSSLLKIACANCSFIHPLIKVTPAIIMCSAQVLGTEVKGPGFAYAHGKETRNHANARRPVNGLDRRKPSNWPGLERQRPSGKAFQNTYLLECFEGVNDRRLVETGGGGRESHSQQRTQLTRTWTAYGSMKPWGNSGSGARALGSRAHVGVGRSFTHAA